MTTIIGTVLLFIVGAVVASAFAWLILGKIAARQHLSGPVELLLEYLPEPSATTPQGLNRAIKALIRRAAIKAPDGKQAMTLIVIRLRSEDLAVLKAAYGLKSYITNLASYHRKIAARKQWKLPQNLDLAVIRFVEDTSRPPMRPALDAASSVAALLGRTRLYQGASDSTGDENTVRQTESTAHRDTLKEERTERGARLVGPGIDRVFFPSEAPITIGRSRQNTLVISGDTVHRQHARLDYADGGWILVPVNLGNSTRVNGSRISQPVSLSGRATLAFGDSGNFTFSG